MKHVFLYLPFNRKGDTPLNRQKFIPAKNSFGSPFLGLLVVRSSVRRLPDTRLAERRKQNKVEDSTMLFKVYSEIKSRKKKISDWRNRRRAGEQGLHIKHIYIINELFLNQGMYLCNLMKLPRPRPWHYLFTIWIINEKHLSAEIPCNQSSDQSILLQHPSKYTSGNKALSCRIMSSSSSSSSCTKHTRCGITWCYKTNVYKEQKLEIFKS